MLFFFFFKKANNKVKVGTLSKIGESALPIPRGTISIMLN